MTDPRTYPEGVPCWVDCAQPDTDAACAFYGELFGWSFSDALPADAPGSYLIATLDGRDAAAITSGDAGWSTYVAVEDADAACARVSAAGGSVVDSPPPNPGGRAVVCTDATGATIRLWQPGRRLGAQAVNEPGSWNFSDLRTGDPDTANAFYASVFGWESGAIDDGSGPLLWRRPGYADHLAATIDPGIHERHAAIGAPPGFQDAVAWLMATTDGAPSHWHHSFAVADRDAAAATAERLGATVLSSMDTPWTKVAELRDPQGAELAISQFTPPD
jgi:predicted enzyme related to lactoylglutathione lyase